MILSPLEQFNILSLYDFSLVNLSNFEFISAKVLLWFWYSLIYITTFLEPIFNLSTTLFPFIKTIIMITADALSLSGGITIMHIIDSIYAGYLSLISTIWYGLYKNLYTVYSIDHLYLIPTFDVISFFFQSSAGVTQGPVILDSNPLLVPLVPLLSTNISLLGLNGNFGVIMSTVYFVLLEVGLIVSTTIYKFTIEPLFYLTTKDFSYLIFSLNSSTIWVSLGFIFTTFLFTASLRNLTLIPQNNWQTLLESLYSTILNVVYENAGSKNVKYFPLIFTTFMIILVCNLLGMIPYSFTVTSHLIVTFSTALAIFVGMNILGILKHGKHFLSLFFPPGAPLALALLLVIIEFVSYVFRVFSLSIRLFANLMSGHTLLKILSGFAWVTVSFWGIFLIPIGIIFLITGLELMIACLQAYIFVVLLCIYINDAINLH